MSTTLRRTAARRRRAATGTRRGAGTPGDPPLGLAAAAPRVAPAGPRTRPARRRRRGDHRRARAGRQRAGHRTSASSGTANPGSTSPIRARTRALDVAAAEQRFGTVEAIAHADVPVPGSVNPVDLRAQDPHGAFGAPMLAPGVGQLPERCRPGRGDAAVAATFSLAIGDSWPVNGRTATSRRHRREPEGPAGRLRPGGSGADQLTVQPDPAHRLQWISGGPLSSAERHRCQG